MRKPKLFREKWFRRTWFSAEVYQENGAGIALYAHTAGPCMKLATARKFRAWLDAAIADLEALEANKPTQ
ncbi:MAG: hypothetical protein V3V08_23470 [Nannocystaceae bacterium]